MSTAQATLFEIFPKKEQNMVMAVFSMGIVVAPTLAPALGGYIVDNYTWPWVFYVNFPIGLVSMFFIWTYLKESVHRTEVGNADWVGISLMIVGLGSLQYVLEEGNRYDWFNDDWILRLSIIAGITLTLFIFWQLSPKNKAPAVELRVLKHSGLLGGILIAMALGFGLYASLFIYPLFAQNILGFSATTTGLVLFPRGIATGVGSILCGRLLDRNIEPRKLIALGMIIFIISMWQLSHLTSVSGEEDTRFALMVCGFGLGFLFIPITVAAMAGLKGKEISQGSALFNFTRQLGGSIGIAFISTYITQMGDFHRSNLVGNINRASQTLSARVNGIAHFLQGHSMSITSAKRVAYGVVNGSIRVQSAVMAYNDAFLLIGLAFVVTLPCLLIMKKTSGKRAA
jgi:DHA2 family multidrug resistance protein